MPIKNMIRLEDGSLSRGVREFFETLPDHVVPVQKAVPPYMPVEKNYFGYYGVTLLNQETDRIQCHICGLWFKHVGSHLKVHGMPHTEYKDKFQLYHNEPLMSLNTLRLYQRRKMKKTNKNLKNGKKHRFVEGGGNNTGVEHGSKKIQFKNRYGTCDAQMKFRFDEAIKKHGRVPHADEETGLYQLVCRRFGNWKVGVETLIK